MVVYLKAKDMLHELFDSKGGQFKIDSYVIKSREQGSPKTKTVISREPGHRTFRLN